MDKYFNKSEPKSKSKMAAIIHSELYVKFRNKEQLSAFCKEYLDLQDNPSFEVSTDRETSEFILTITDIIWANNLVWIAQLLDKYDYNDGD